MRQYAPVLQAAPISAWLKEVEVVNGRAVNAVEVTDWAMSDDGGESLIGERNQLFAG